MLPYKKLSPDMRHKYNSVYIDLIYEARLTLAQQLAQDETIREVEGWDGRYAITNTGRVFSLTTLNPILVTNGHCRLSRDGNRYYVKISDLYEKTYKKPLTNT